MKLRIQMTKEGNLRFISHLEYSRTLNRAVRRAKLPIAYSEGFNPHIKMSLASALGVGIASLSEYAEFELASEIDVQQAQTALNDNLPQGIRVLAADIVEKKTAKLMAMLSCATYRAIVAFADQQQAIKAIEDYNKETGAVLYTKKMAPGKPRKQIDMKQFVSTIDYEIVPEGIQMTFDAVITPTGTIKAYDILGMLEANYNVPFDVLSADITRTGLYTTNKQPLIAKR